MVLTKAANSAFNVSIMQSLSHLPDRSRRIYSQASPYSLAWKKASEAQKHAKGLQDMDR